MPAELGRHIADAQLSVRAHAKLATTLQNTSLLNTNANGGRGPGGGGQGRFGNGTPPDGLGNGTAFPGGRNFTRAERTADAGVAILSETIARQLWPNGDGVGVADDDSDSGDQRRGLAGIFRTTIQVGGRWFDGHV